ncbi:MAG: Sensor histidine kinase RcsC [Gemmatimonadaceae bacterium]|nr:Sensor histidine kinase RcsC [Gemmatimonadaceae bacterium]
MRKSRILTHDRFRGPPSASPAAPSTLRELLLVREIVHAFLHADRPNDVFQFAIERVSPMVGASFACIYLIDGVAETMRLAATFNWPEPHRPWLSEYRVRLGFGPSGEAAAERRVIEVHDVFADKDLEDWQEVAQEMGFRSLVALPLQTAKGVIGTATFYYAGTGAPTPETRGLLRIVADQMAATAEKAALIDELRRANVSLRESNEALENEFRAALAARHTQEDLLASVARDIRSPLTSVLGYLNIVRQELSGPLTEGQRADLSLAHEASAQVLGVVDDMLDLTSLRRGTLDVVAEEFDPRLAVTDAVTSVQGRPESVELRVQLSGEDTLVPLMRSDREKVGRILSRLLANAYKFTAHGAVTIGVECRGDRAAFVVQDTGIGISRDAQQAVFEESRPDFSLRETGGRGLGLVLSRRLARLLGGDIFIDSAPGEGSTFTVELPLELNRGDARE